MNFPIAVLLLCALIGLADKMIGGRFGLAEEFDRGMTMMGSLAVTMSGVYCFSVMLGRLLSTVLQGVSLPLDPTILVSSVLATDMGAYSIADTLCTDYTQKIFSGVLRYSGNYHLFFSSNCFGKYSLQRFQESDDRNGVRHHCYSGCPDYRKPAFWHGSDCTIKKSSSCTVNLCFTGSVYLLWR